LVIAPYSLAGTFLDACVTSIVRVEVTYINTDVIIWVNLEYLTVGNVVTCDVNKMNRLRPSKDSPNS
jgi:hypothetical protein